MFFFSFFFYPTILQLGLTLECNTLWLFFFFFCTYLSKNDRKHTHHTADIFQNKTINDLKGVNRLNGITGFFPFRVLPGIFFCTNFGGVKWWQKGCECWLSSNVKWQENQGGGGATALGSWREGLLFVAHSAKPPLSSPLRSLRPHRPANKKAGVQSSARRGGKRRRESRSGGGRRRVKWWKQTADRFFFPSLYFTSEVP